MLDRTRQLGSDGANRSAAVWIETLHRIGQSSLRMGAAALQRQRDSSPYSLDIRVNSSIAVGECTVGRLGPDEWLVSGPASAHELFTETLGRQLDGTFFSLVDISDRYVNVAISGVRARDVLSCGCPLDLHPAAFPSQSVTRTLLGKAEIVLWYEGASQVWVVACARSFANYVYGLLEEFSREFSAE